VSDGSKSLSARDFRMGTGNSWCYNFSATMGASWQLEMLLLYHRWMANLPHVYDRWRPYYL